ncbi:SRPBCC family protein [Pseudonocardia sp. HH130629-09]|uniref:SRPBCC family protein n=1 Tax=Pseudonocardia sp. HH130629-09 TaxID=1641402 RepID=UPI0006CB6793|nr:carbon monoxide dehydrogenase subunit G [Pseudonocardia sp. HH130629-09]ALE85723.1 carbon monoxide dehydrogenase [Pseudonocardia sp. HH130629-09]
MKISGSNVVEHPVERVWEALLDPRVLVATIPGCERLEPTGENAYAMTVTAGVAAIRGTYTGSCALSKLEPHESLVMTLNGAGGPGTVDAVVDVTFDDLGSGGTRIGYTADATVGGMVGGVGQRMLASVSTRMADRFFDAVGAAIGAGGAAAVPAVPAVPGPAVAVAEPAPLVGAPAYAEPMTGAEVFTSAPAAGGPGSGELTRGIGIGAAVALLGVLVGAVVGRRR